MVLGILSGIKDKIFKQMPTIEGVKNVGLRPEGVRRSSGVKRS
jgi:hypothetical protein